MNIKNEINTSLYAWRCGIPSMPQRSHLNILSASEAIELLLLEAPPRECGLWFGSLIADEELGSVGLCWFEDVGWCWTLKDGKGLWGLLGIAGDEATAESSGDAFRWFGKGPLLWLWWSINMWIWRDFMSGKVLEHCWHDCGCLEESPSFRIKKYSTDKWTYNQYYVISD